ncbi:MAG: relaxase domain-containing protein [Acidimicrobiales bacterium]
MLGINPLAGGGEGYYVAAVAEGVDEYLRGPEVGVSGLDPRTSDQLGRFANRTVSGFDLCWRAPKSVSLMFAFGDPEIFGAPEPELDHTHAPQPDNRQPAELVRDALHRDASKELAVESPTHFAGEAEFDAGGVAGPPAGCFADSSVDRWIRLEASWPAR